jgi:hypothetical protein
MQTQIQTVQTVEIKSMIAQGATYENTCLALVMLMPDNVRAMNSFFLSRAGQYTSITYKRDCKVLKSCIDAIVKVTTSIFRVGVEYNNIGRVITSHNNGEVAKEGLDKGNYKLSPILYFSMNTGKFRFAIAPTFNTNVMRTAKYYRNDVEINKEDLYGELASSEMSIDDMAKANRPCNRKSEDSEALLLTFNPEGIIDYH